MQQHDVTAAILYRNDEEIVGTAVARLTEFLRSQNLSFEVLAVDVASHDNSTALLTLMRRQFPELRITTAPARTPHLHAAQVARGTVLWLTTPEGIDSSLGHFAAAFQQVAKEERELVVISERVALAHRARILASLHGLRSHGRRLPRGLVNRARFRGDNAGARVTAGRPRRTRARWLASLVSLLALERSP